MSDVVLTQAHPICPTRGEAVPGSLCGTLPRLGYLTLKQPLANSFPVSPQTYRCGFNKHGDIIGHNTFVPYPGEFPKYHNIPFARNVEWGGLLEAQPTVPEIRQTKKSVAAEIAEYFTAENDEGYQKWSEKKCEERKVQEERQKELGKVPKDIHQQPGHHMPTIFQTTNETYGAFLDLVPKYPAVYPLPTKPSNLPTDIEVRLEKSNISTQTRIPDHPFIFAQNRQQQVPVGSFSRPNTAYVPVQRRADLGEREEGFTFPMYSPFGRELSRPHVTGQSYFCESERPKVYSLKVPGKSPHAMTHNRKQVCVPYTLRPPSTPARMVQTVPQHRVVFEAIPMPTKIC